MPSIPRPRLLRTKINKPGVRRILINSQDYALDEIGQKLVRMITPLYHDAEGQPYLWKWKVEHDRRTSRASLLVYCDNEEVRHKEAAQGLIAKELRKMVIRGKIRIIAGATGLRFK